VRIDSPGLARVGLSLLLLPLLGGLALSGGCLSTGTLSGLFNPEPTPGQPPGDDDDDASPTPPPVQQNAILQETCSPWGEYGLELYISSAVGGCSMDAEMVDTLVIGWVGFQTPNVPETWDSWDDEMAMWATMCWGGDACEQVDHTVLTLTEWEPDNSQTVTVRGSYTIDFGGDYNQTAPLAAVYCQRDIDCFR